MLSSNVTANAIHTDRIRKRHRAEDQSIAFGNYMKIDLAYEEEAGFEPISSQTKAPLVASEASISGSKGLEMDPIRNTSDPVTVKTGAVKPLFLTPHDAEEGNSDSVHGVSPDLSEGGSVGDQRDSLGVLTPPMPFARAPPSFREAPFPRTRGAITTLRSIAQLAELLHSPPLSPARYTKVNGHALVPSSPFPSPVGNRKGGVREEGSGDPPLRLCNGESVLVVLHNGRTSLAELVNEHTARLAHIRIFTLDLTQLPPREYKSAADEDKERNKTNEKDHNGREVKNDDNDEEEALLIARPSAPTPRRAAPPREWPPTAADEHASQPLSGQLLQASEHLAQRLGGLLRVDAVLNLPLADSAGEGCREPFLFPAMVLWRAGGGDHAEYPPTPPEGHSTRPTPASREDFAMAMAARGGPVVVKPIHAVSAVHSIALYTPVYTMPHLFRTVMASVRASWARDTSSKSQTLLYFGASWCPPCMRIVGAMPQIITEDMPESMHVFLKADMDLATPIYEFFGVQTIPTFIVLDNKIMLDHHVEATANSGAEPMDSTQIEVIVQKAFTKAELGRIQNSQRSLVKLFLEKHCTTLSFVEDF
ncbi:unnamed protein product [Phytomonas sp. Hart1]|nr:unnamed protein product [Phytomonas sp. Hart1]|eukprot:CCW68822.1 unnamed protein product [Phytomonas sp. isolate Hart1]